MTGPVSTKGVTLAVSGVIAVLASLLTGCGSQVPGQPVAVKQTAVTRYVSAGLGTLLPDPSQFPARYPAVVLPPEAAAQAAGDLTGVPRGATVRPRECAPPQQGFGPDETAVTVGTDNENRATLTVELTRTTQPLSALREQLARCGEMRVTGSGTTTTVRTELQDRPRVDADDALALRRTVLPDTGRAGLTQSMQTRTAQVEDVRITVTYMTFSDAEPDAAALEEIFSSAVEKVRAA
ncbi:sensor domain-containing protein [Nocardia sp. NPDC005366]|uniref:sensor domain-containing protein n=1 Tax=Nocardia sp. NPDC005366 TaxID=3156878 RepID=UPI0033AB1FC6